MASRRRRQRGFTLVELLVALAIFLIASMGLVPLLHNGIRGGQRNALHTEARRLAGEAMAVLHSTDFAGLAGRDAQYAAGRGHEVRVTVAPDQPAPGQALLTVEVTWVAAGRSGSYRLQSLRVQP